MLCNTMLLIHNILKFLLHIWLYFTQNRSFFCQEYVEIDDVDGNFENNKKNYINLFSIDYLSCFVCITVSKFSFNFYICWIEFLYMHM